MKFVLVALLVGACLTVSWPSATKTITKSAPITVKDGQTFDGFRENGNKWVRYDRGRKNLGNCKNVEGGKKDAVFLLGKGATLKNVILGANAVEHVHCESEGCTGAKFYVKGGAARNGSDKIIQHNSAGTVYISNFYCENSGKLYRACGNCKSGYQGKRTVVMNNVTVKNVGTVAGYNRNYGDTVTLTNISVTGGHVCRAFQGRNDGKEPTALGYQCDRQGKFSCTCR